MEASAFPFAVPPADLFHFDVGDDVGDCEDGLFFEAVPVEGLEVEVDFFVAVFEDAVDGADVGPVLDLVVEELDSLPPGVGHRLERLVRPFEHVSGPGGAAPEDVDVQRFLDVLLLYVLV